LKALLNVIQAPTSTRAVSETHNVTESQEGIEPIMKSSGKGLIRSLNRRGAKADKSPPVARRTAGLKEPAVCERCGAVYSRKTWRKDRRPGIDILARATWTVCPACKQIAELEYFGKVRIAGAGALENLDAIRRRIANVERRAAVTQPERRLVSEDFDGQRFEILTTSQKLAHRIAHELVKAFGGTATYAWSSDGSLLATWRFPQGRARGQR
jgi:hypothetical protein